MLVDKSCKTIDITSEARAIGEETLKPAEVATDELHHHADEEHGEECAPTDDVPLPCAEKDIAGNNTENHERHIHTHLDLRKIYSRDTAHRYGETFARHRYTAATHLKGYAHAEHETPSHLC